MKSSRRGNRELWQCVDITEITIMIRGTAYLFMYPRAHMSQIVLLKLRVAYYRSKKYLKDKQTD